MRPLEFSNPTGNPQRAHQEQLQQQNRAQQQDLDLYALDCKRMEGLYYSYASLADDLAGAAHSKGEASAAAAGPGSGTITNAPRRSSQQRPGTAGRRGTAGSLGVALAAAVTVMGGAGVAGGVGVGGGAGAAASAVVQLGSYGGDWPGSSRPGSARTRGAGVLDAAGVGGGTGSKGSGGVGGRVAHLMGEGPAAGGGGAGGGTLGRGQQQQQEQYPMAKGLVKTVVEGVARPASARARRD